MSDRQERIGQLYPFATIGARTDRGGCATSGNELCISGLPAACVGVDCMLDNGDVINESPYRDVQTSTVFVPVNGHGVELRRE
ncbi:hypothetical protein E2553_12125 [Paraburkholderia dipogonis]|uniref:PAAR domain-containing protein n=1 Tax=Paraburkholderia dipogonis TaxID=1211383 RepID=A0A4Y8N7D2_9BURK|nr:hypothetical protein [Paraburkholderia dipogonis]TFE45697.1 hypothetical protein E2553_12125 [Paraburkholderia dipogonis]